MHLVTPLMFFTKDGGAAMPAAHLQNCDPEWQEELLMANRIVTNRTAKQ